MKDMVLAYGAAALVMAGLDLVWLGLTGDALYRANLSAVMADRLVNLPAAIIFYFLYVGGIVYFGVRPALAGGQWQGALASGFLLGLLCYMTYDLTNLATLKTWSVKVTVLDIAWGSCLSAAASLGGYLAVRMLR